MTSTTIRLVAAALFLGGLVAVNPDIVSLPWQTGPQIQVTQVSSETADVVASLGSQMSAVAVQENTLEARSDEGADKSATASKSEADVVESVSVRERSSHTAANDTPSQAVRPVGVESGNGEAARQTRLVDILRGQGIAVPTRNNLPAAGPAVGAASSTATPLAVTTELAVNNVTVVEDAFADEIGEGEVVSGPSPIDGDVNEDGIVDFADFLALSNNFGQDGSRSDGDLNGNGVVDFGDFLQLQTSFGNQTSTYAP